jgi:hypothetical protein
VPVVVGLVVLLGGLAVSVKLYRQYGDAQYQVRVVSVSEFTERAVTIVFDVRLRPGDTAVCVLRARDRAGAQVGRAEVTVVATDASGSDVVHPIGPPPEGWARTRHVLETSAPAFVGDAVGCHPPE